MPCAQVVLKQPFFNVLFTVFKECDYERVSKSRKSGIGGIRSAPCTKVALITASKDQLLSTDSYKSSRSKIMTESQNFGKQTFMGRAPTVRTSSTHHSE